MLIKESWKLKKTEVILEWSRPNEAGIALSKKALKYGMKRLLVIPLIVAVFELVIYWGISSLPLDETDFDLNRGLITVFLSAIAMCLLCFVIEPFFARYKKIFTVIP